MELVNAIPPIPVRGRIVTCTGGKLQFLLYEIPVSSLRNSQIKNWEGNWELRR
jgi:hypothetical protein